MADPNATLDELKQAIQDAIVNALNQFSSGNTNRTAGNSLADLCDCFTKNSKMLNESLHLIAQLSIDANKSLNSLSTVMASNTQQQNFPTNPPAGKTPPNLFQRFKTGLSNLPVGNTAGTIQLGADLAGMIPKVGGAIGGVVAFGASLWRGVEKLKSWGDQLHQANIQFAEFSGSMAVVQAESAFRRAQLSQERGERRAPFAKELAESNDRFARAMAPLEDTISNGWNKVIGWLERRAAPALEWVNRRLGIEADKIPPTIAPSEILYHLGKETLKDNEYGNYDAFK